MIQSELNDLEKMNSQILLKINNFVKNRLIELLGSLLIVVSIFLLLSITTYSGGQENFIFKPENSINLLLTKLFVFIKNPEFIFFQSVNSLCIIY